VLRNQLFFCCDYPSIIVVVVNSANDDTQSHEQKYLLLSVMVAINVMLILLLASTVCIMKDLRVASFERKGWQYQIQETTIWTVIIMVQKKEKNLLQYFCVYLFVCLLLLPILPTVIGLKTKLILLQICGGHKCSVLIAYG